MTDERLGETLRRAIALHQAGQLAEAGQLYLSILESHPEQADVHHNLGLLAMQIHRTDEGVYHFQRALAIDPHEGRFWLSFIQTLISLGRYVEARQVLQQGRLLVGLQGPAVDDLMCQLAQPNAESISKLLDLFKQGRHADAESEANQLISRFPEHGLSWKVLGLCLQEQGRISEALMAMHKAVEFLLDDEEANLHFATALHGQGRLEEAIAGFRRVLHINPDNIQACSSLGIINFNLGRYREAEGWLLKIVESNPASSEAWLNLGLTFQAQGRLQEAEHSIRQALLISPQFAKFHHHLSIVLKMQGRLSDAEMSSRQALMLEPDFPEAYGNLGAICFDQGRYADAEGFFAKALAIRPNYPEAYNNLGTCQQIQRKLLAAESSYRQAIALNPRFAEAHTNLGINLQSQGRVPEAESCWRKSLDLNPDQITTQSGLVFHLTYSARFPDSDYLVEAKKYGRMVAERVAAPFADWLCEPRPERLRVGLVSGDLRNHPVGHFLRGLLSQVNATRLEFIAYATQPGTDDFSTEIRPFFSDWKNIGGLSDEAAAATIHGDAIHILIDLAGHSSHNRLPLFAWKPAPLQVSWLGYLASTGVETIDYILSDPHSIRAEDQGNFTEAIWRMPESCICFTPSDSSVAVNPLPALTGDVFTFGSFNNLAKMGDAVVALWAKVLHSVPNSRLYLKAGQLSQPAIVDATRQRFAGFGIQGERLIIAETKASHAEHLATYHNIDIALDTFPYPGVTTSVEALWMGVPVLTLRGDGILARAGESININAGLMDWIAEDADDYVAKAALFAGDRLKLSELRNTLRSKLLSTLLFDHSRFAEHFDDALWAMWCSHLDKAEG